MMKALKAVGDVLTWPFRKLGQMFAIGDRFDKLEQKIGSTREVLEERIGKVELKIDLTRALLEEKLNGLRTELNSSMTNVNLKLDHPASKFEVMDDLAELKLRLDRLERKSG